MNNLREVSLASLGPPREINFVGRGESGPVRAFVHNRQDSEKLPVVKSDGSNSPHYQSTERTGTSVPMDLYDTRRANLGSLIKSLKMTHASFGRAVGYNGQYIGQLVNGTKRSSGGKAIVTDKVITKILAKLKTSAPDLTREWFDKPQAEAPEVQKNPRAKVVVVGSDEDFAATMVGEPTALLVDDDKFPDHLSSTWPYMTTEQRAAIRYLEAGFRAVKKRK